MTVVLVGDRATITASLRDARLTLDPIEVDAEGRTAAEASAQSDKPKPKTEKPKTAKPKTEKPKP
jgi:hypothetical protein